MIQTAKNTKEDMKEGMEMEKEGLEKLRSHVNSKIIQSKSKNC